MTDIKTYHPVTITVASAIGGKRKQLEISASELANIFTGLFPVVNSPGVAIVSEHILQSLRHSPTPFNAWLEQVMQDDYQLTETDRSAFDKYIGRQLQARMVNGVSRFANTAEVLLYKEHAPPEATQRQFRGMLTSSAAVAAASTAGMASMGTADEVTAIFGTAAGAVMGAGYIPKLYNYHLIEAQLKEIVGRVNRVIAYEQSDHLYENTPIHDSAYSTKELEQFCVQFLVSHPAITSPVEALIHLRVEDYLRNFSLYANRHQTSGLENLLTRLHKTDPVSNTNEYVVSAADNYLINEFMHAQQKGDTPIEVNMRSTQAMQQHLSRREWLRAAGLTAAGFAAGTALAAAEAHSAPTREWLGLSTPPHFIESREDAIKRTKNSMLGLGMSGAAVGATIALLDQTAERVNASRLVQQTKKALQESLVKQGVDLAQPAAAQER